MIWRLDNRNRGCRVSQEVKTSLLPDYIVCYKPFLQPADVWTFKENDRMHFESVVKDPEKIYDEPIHWYEEDQFSGYQLPCRGDSGAGNWVKRLDFVLGYKYVLVGIHSIGSGACGKFAMMEKINNEKCQVFKVQALSLLYCK